MLCSTVLEETRFCGSSTFCLTYRSRFSKACVVLGLECCRVLVQEMYRRQGFLVITFTGPTVHFKVWSDKLLGIRMEEGHQMPKSLSNSSLNYTSGSVKNNTKTPCPCRSPQWNLCTCRSPSMGRLKDLNVLLNRHRQHSLTGE